MPFGIIPWRAQPHEREPIGVSALPGIPLFAKIALGSETRYVRRVMLIGSRISGNAIVGCRIENCGRRR